MDEEEKIREELVALEEEHRALDALIAGASMQDRLQAQRLKKRKLWLKDEISRLYDLLEPDIIA